METFDERRDSSPWLVADIGGSNARFGWLCGAGAKVRDIRSLPVFEHAGPAEAAKNYLAQLSATLGTDYRTPRHAAFAVATAVAGDDFALTNSRWTFSRSQLRSELALESLVLLNDFEALALSLPRLQASQLRSHTALPVPAGTLAVIGPGTGLGVAGLVQTRAGWMALPGEGGHATLAAADDYESELFVGVRRIHPHVSAERLLSGIGLPVLRRAIGEVEGKAMEPVTAELIVDLGLSGKDALCGRTLEVFCALLGSFAGSVALTLGARGGVYIGGGIVPRLGEFFFDSDFRERFEGKGRLRGYLRDIPTAVITDTMAALTGAAAAIEGRDCPTRWMQSNATAET